MPKRRDTSTKAKGEPKAKKSKQSNASAKKTKTTKATKTKGSKAKPAPALSAPAATTKVAPAPATPAKAPVVKVTSPRKTSSSLKKKGELSDEAIEQFIELSDKVKTVGKVTPSDLSQFTAADLKLVLKQNDRSSTGNKGELSKSVADCMTNGCPPRCPECGGGRLRVKPNGSYFCPGYMEDDEFQNCGFKCIKGGVVRIPWKNPG